MSNLKNRFLPRVNPTNIATWTSIIGSFLMALASLFGFLFSPATGLLLILLNLYVISNQLQRNQERKFREKMMKIATSRPVSKDFLFNLSELPPLSGRLHDTKEIWVSGLTLVGFIVSNRIALKEFIDEGGSLKLLITPEFGGVAESAENFTLLNRKRHGDDIRVSKNIIKEWMSESKNVEVRELPVFPSHYLFIKNPMEPHGEAQIHLSLYKESSDTSPMMIIHREDAIEKFSSFKDEYMKLWAASAPIEG